MEEKIPRREFIKEVALGAGLAAGIPMLPLFGTSRPLEEAPSQASTSPRSTKSVVAVVTDIACIDEKYKINEARVEAMFQTLLAGLTGRSLAEEAWREILPVLKPTTVIGLKINCINPKLPTHPAVTYAITKSLISAGIRENNIIIWDRCEGNILEGLGKCGYTVNLSNEGVRCFGAGSEGIGFDEGEYLKVPSVGRQFPVTKIISQMCDYLINVSVLKDHGIAGATLSLKNLYGAIPLWNYAAVADTNRMHRNHAATQIAELYNNPIIRDKFILNVCDALLGCYDGGPHGRPQWKNCQLLASTDPVALDWTGLQIIDGKRKAAGFPPASPRAGHIGVAAELNVGTNNPQEIELRSYSIG